MSELRKVQLDDGRKVEVAEAENSGQAAGRSGEPVTVVGELATAETVLVVQKPDGTLFAAKGEDLDDDEPERSGPQT